MNERDADFFEPVEYPKTIRVPVGASRCSAATERVHEPAASQDGNNAMAIAAVQQACESVVSRITNRVSIRLCLSPLQTMIVREIAEDVLQTEQRRLTEKDANHAG